jgi:hypothetical protein
MSDVRAMLQPLIQQARAEGKWLWTSYQDIWFSPDELDAQNANGKFLWGPVNWKLRDPGERLAEAEKRLAAAQREVDLVRAKL